MGINERLVLQTSDDVLDVVPRLGGQAIHYVLDAIPGIWHTRVRREVPADEFRFTGAVDHALAGDFVTAVANSDSSLPVLFRDIRR